MTHENLDGVNRQRIIRRCRPGEELQLLREPGNRYDRGAIAIVRANGEHLGYIPEHVSRFGDPTGMAERMDLGMDFRCRISEITGGWGGKFYGVNIEITDGVFPEFHPTESGTGLPTASTPEWSHATLWLLFALAVVVALVVFIARTE